MNSQPFALRGVFLDSLGPDGRGARSFAIAVVSAR
jgi:hypothetical protein